MIIDYIFCFLREQLSQLIQTRK